MGGRMGCCEGSVGCNHPTLAGACTAHITVCMFRRIPLPRPTATRLEHGLPEVRREISSVALPTVLAFWSLASPSLAALCVTKEVYVLTRLPVGIAWQRRGVMATLSPVLLQRGKTVMPAQLRRCQRLIATLLLLLLGAGGGFASCRGTARTSTLAEQVQPMLLVRLNADREGGMGQSRCR